MGASRKDYRQLLLEAVEQEMATVIDPAACGALAIKILQSGSVRPAPTPPPNLMELIIVSKTTGKASVVALANVDLIPFHAAVFSGLGAIAGFAADAQLAGTVSIVTAFLAAVSSASKALTKQELAFLIEVDQFGQGIWHEATAVAESANRRLAVGSKIEGDGHKAYKALVEKGAKLVWDATDPPARVRADEAIWGA